MVTPPGEHSLLKMVLKNQSATTSFPDEILRWTDVKVLFQNPNYASWLSDLDGMKPLLRCTPTGQEMVLYTGFFVSRIQSLQKNKTKQKSNKKNIFSTEF